MNGKYFFILYFNSTLKKKLSYSLFTLHYFYIIYNPLNYILGTENGYLIM